MVYLDNWTIEMQFATGVWTDVTEDVINKSVKGEYGIRDNGPTDRVASTGRMTFSLNNSESNSLGVIGLYSPGRATCRTGFTSGIPVRARFSGVGLTRTKFYGKIAPDGIKPAPGIYGERKTEVTVLDWMNQAATHELDLPAYTTNKRIEQVVALIVANMPLAPLSTNYAVGNDTFVSVFDTVTSKTKALSEFQKLALSEYGFIYVQPTETSDECLTVENRNAKITGIALTNIPQESGNLLMDIGGITSGNLISDNFESGGFSAGWTSQSTDGGHLSVATAAKLHGSYGMSCLIADTESMGCWYQGASKSEMRIRFYVDPNTISIPTNEAITILDTWTFGWGATLDMYLKKTSTGYEITSQCRNDTNGVITITSTLTDAPHCVEIHWKASTGAGNNNGIWEMWLDGILIDSITTVDNDTKDLANLLFGPSYVDSVNIAGTIYLDDFVANDDGSAIGELDYTSASYLLQDGSGDKILLDAAEPVTFTDTAIKPEISYGKHLANIVTATNYPRRYDTSATVLFAQQSYYTIPAGGSITGYKGSYRDPVGAAQQVAGKNMVTPVATTDYLMNADSAGSGADLTANLAVTATYGVSDVEYTLVSSATVNAYITKLQARGLGIYLYDPIDYKVEDATSKLDNGSQSLSIDMPYQDQALTAKIVTDAEMRNLHYPRHELDKWPFMANRNVDNMAAFLSVKIGDRIHFTETQTGLDKDRFIDGIEWELIDGIALKCTWKTREPLTFGVWLVEVAGATELDTTTILG
jgi:hypothetical protein